MHNPRSIFTAPSQCTASSISSSERFSARRRNSESVFSAATPCESVNTTPIADHRAHHNIAPLGASAFSSTATEVRKPLSGSRSVGGPFKSPQNTLLTLGGPSTSSSKLRTKRSFEAQSSPAGRPGSVTSRKRARTERRSKHILDPFSFSGPSVNTGTPPSPLFFSNSLHHPRPVLPPRFSSSEAGATMLSNTRDEATSVKTVTMARGAFATRSPPSTRPPSHSRNSVESVSPSGLNSPTSDTMEQLRVLGQIGITELLEQDERPTFIVDLGNRQNYKPGPLQVVFANSALRTWDSLLEQISGRAENDPSTPSTVRTFPQFKAWLLGAAKNGESLNVCLPSFILGDISFSCSTLRRRMRIISGTLLSTALHSSLTHVTRIPMVSASTATSSIAEPIRTPTVNSDVSTVISGGNAAEDYFGNAVWQTSNSKTPESIDTTIVLPSIERSLSMKSIATPNAQSTGDELTHQISRHGSINSSSCFDISDDNAAQQSVTSAIDPDGSAAGDHPVSNSNRNKEVNFFDWTRLPASVHLPAHVQFARSVDWASTALGPIEAWPPDLRQMCNLIMASPYPAAMYWGKDLVAIYNEAYILLAGQKHPKLMGQTYAEAWSEIWEEVREVFASAQSTGQATMKDDDCLFIYRNDFLEETYFSWSIIPMVGGDGSVMGLYNPAFEKTRRHIAERRMFTLRDIGERTAAARDVKGFWDEVLAALEQNELDTPFVLLYSVGDEPVDTDASSIHSGSILGSKQCYLEGALGVPPGHEAAPEIADLKTSNKGFIPVFREVMSTSKPKVLNVASGDIPVSLLQGMAWRGFGDPAKCVVVCPIHPTTGKYSLGFLVMGINPRRPYDDDYSLFIQLLSRQLATSLASVVLFEEEIRRGQKAAKLAAQDRIELSEQLAARTQEAIESETKFTRMAEFAPVGMLIADSEGRITYCNDTWYLISRVPKETKGTDRWIDYVKNEDRPLVEELWHNLVANTQSVTVEFRFKAPWMDRHGTMGDTWVLFSAYPETNEQGLLKSVFASLTNISQQKWAEGFQKRKMEEAVELKRQQENFIDITSHEMRNPLSAILQCSDEIISSLTEARSKKDKNLQDSLLDDNIDAAQTISLCAQHQKRIVDDVLTLSKLDSALIMVTPVDVQPLAVVKRALKMFEGELHTADIQMKFVVDPSIKKLGIDWLRFDPSRVLQVLINCLTNAIKFTTTEKKRTIAVTIAASTTKPSAHEKNVVNYFPSRSKRADIMQGSDWGTGEEIYIHFAVQDTGRGLSDEEKKLLFLRFSQASPRTHVQYGGSGLGLFISRELTELQGGEIGVASEAGKGSTFAFFIKAKRSTAPKDPDEHLAMTGGHKHSDSKIASKGSNDQAQAPKTRDFAVPSVIGEEKQPLKILIVEDNLVNQRVLQKQLKNMGCIVHVANHGGEALDRLRESWFWAEKKEKNVLELSAVLMDLEMPVMDGLTCTRKIRELEQQGKLSRHVPIIAVTANARAEQINTAMEAGMDDVVSKPFRIPDLIPKIEELVARYPEPKRAR